MIHPWPPLYSVKKNSLAKSVRFKITNKNQLTIILPPRFSEKHVPDLLEKNKSWILENLQPKSIEFILPRQINLKAAQRTLHLEYIATSGKLRCIAKPQDEWVFYGDIHQHQKILKNLKSILKNEALTFLHHQLMKLSSHCQLPFNEFTLRDQSTRWGSCSYKKNISLNQQLIFLDIHLVNYVIIHELCHTIELNHSDRFWKLVEKFDPNWRIHRQALRRAHDELPEWLKY